MTVCNTYIYCLAPLPLFRRALAVRTRRDYNALNINIPDFVSWTRIELRAFHIAWWRGSYASGVCAATCVFPVLV